MADRKLLLIIVALIVILSVADTQFFHSENAGEPLRPHRHQWDHGRRHDHPAHQRLLRPVRRLRHGGHGDHHRAHPAVRDAGLGSDRPGSRHCRRSPQRRAGGEREDQCVYRDPGLDDHLPRPGPCHHQQPARQGQHCRLPVFGQASPLGIPLPVFYLARGLRGSLVRAAIHEVRAQRFRHWRQPPLFPPCRHTGGSLHLPLLRGLLVHGSAGRASS